MFKKGDIVYYISNIYNLKHDTPYKVLSVFSGFLLVEGFDGITMFTSRFISEQEYKIRQRNNKIKRIRCLK